MLSIRKEENFFKRGFGIRYVTIWDSIFKKLSSSGPIYFCKAAPGYLVHVDVGINFEKLTVYYAKHNATDIEERIRQRETEIKELARKEKRVVFVLDVLNMRIITRKDFTYVRPVNGMSTLFIVKDYDAEGVFYMLVNPTAFADAQVYSVLLCYLYSTAVCIPTIVRNSSLYSKQMFQVLTSMIYTKSPEINFEPGGPGLFDSVQFNTIPFLSLKASGKTTRLTELAKKAKEQNLAALEKKTKLAGG